MAPGAGSVTDLGLPREEASGQRDEVSRTERAVAMEVQWGGFFRRGCAFLVDLVILSVLSCLLFYFSYVGYKVGLATGQGIHFWHAWGEFLTLTLFGWFFLVIGYFVLFHGMEGSTIGKRLLGLKVVGADQRPVTYRQALLRAAAAVLAAVSVVGILWILWSREKRGWHDLLAGTWVIRDRSRLASEDE